MSETRQETTISRRKAFWTGVALMPLWVAVMPFAFVHARVWKPFRKFCEELGEEWLTDKPWKAKP